MKAVTTQIDWELVGFIGLDETLLVMAIEDEAVNVVREMSCVCGLMDYGGRKWVSVSIEGLRQSFPTWEAERFNEAIGTASMVSGHMLDEDGGRVLVSASKPKGLDLVS